MCLSHPELLITAALDISDTEYAVKDRSHDRRKCLRSEETVYYVDVVLAEDTGPVLSSCLKLFSKDSGP